MQKIFLVWEDIQKSLSEICENCLSVANDFSLTWDAQNTFFNLSTFHLKDEHVVLHFLISLRAFQMKDGQMAPLVTCDTVLQKSLVTNSYDHGLSRCPEFSTVELRSPTHGSQGPSDCLFPEGKTPTDLQSKP